MKEEIDIISPMHNSMSPPASIILEETFSFLPSNSFSKLFYSNFLVLKTH